MKIVEFVASQLFADGFPEPVDFGQVVAAMGGIFCLNEGTKFGGVI